MKYFSKYLIKYLNKILNKSTNYILYQQQQPPLGEAILYKHCFYLFGLANTITCYILASWCKSTHYNSNNLCIAVHFPELKIKKYFMSL